MKGRKASRARLQEQARGALMVAGAMFIGEGQWNASHQELWLLEVLTATARGEHIRLTPRRQRKKRRRRLMLMRPSA